MPLTNAEKQRRYREKLKNDPVKMEEIRKKNLERIKKNTKKVQDMTDEEKYDKRKMWRRQKQQQKEKKNAENKNKNTEKGDRPADNPKLSKRLKKLTIRFNKSMDTIEKLNKTIGTLRKRNYRLNIFLMAKMEQKTKEIDKLNCRTEVLESMIKGIYKSSDKFKKRHIKQLALNETRRHNVFPKHLLAKCLGVTRVRKYKKVSQIDKLISEISNFFLRDDITRITAGKKECRTKNKEKQQIRYMTDTLRNLYKIYKSEGGKQSFSTFYKNKPFFVLSPTAQSRDTCMCIKHSNMDYLLKALISKELFARGTTLKEILKSVTCDITSFNCMHGICSNCLHSTIEFKVDNRENEEAKWLCWQSEKHTYTKKDKNSGEDKEINTRKTTKQIKTGTLLELIQTFYKKIKLFKKHYFNMKTQQAQYQTCLKDLRPDEVLLVCDYSENYNTKLSEEIQSMHFGASKEQVTLHCVMIYWKDKCQSICTVSESPCHEPAAIWAHLVPVIKFIREQTPNTKVLHIFSDGPTTQYRQKKNYFLLNTFIKKFEFAYATWSFTESGHGKGVADGIGGAVKRCLDRQVLYGHDIRNADDVFTNINAAMKSVKPFLIPIEEIENVKKIIRINLRPLTGNNDVHQIITTNEENIVLHRPLSCFCGSNPGMCSCYSPKRHTLLNPSKKQRLPVITEQCENISEVIASEEMPLQDNSGYIVNEDFQNIISENNVVHTEFPSESSQPDNYGYVEGDQASNQSDQDETICMNDNESMLSIDTSTILNNLDESDVFKNLQHLKGPIDLQLSPLIHATTSEDVVASTSLGIVKTAPRSPRVKILSDVTLSWENAKFYRKTKIQNENRNPNQVKVAHNNSKHQQQSDTLIQSEKQTKKYNYFEDSDESDDYNIF